MRAVALLALSALAVTASASLAVDTIEIAAQAAGEISNVPLADSQGPASSGSLFASVNWGPGQGFNDPTGAAVAWAAQDVEGRSAVLVEAIPYEPGSDFQNGGTRWTRMLTHPGQTPAEYVYAFFLNPPRLALREPVEIADPDALAEYEITVKFDGVTVFHSRATLTSDANGSQLVEEGTDLGGTFFSYPASGIYGYQFSAYDGMISLGMIDPGQTMTVESTLACRTEIGAQGMGAQANIGDPLDLDGDPGVRGMLFAPGFVSVESTGWSGIKALYR